MKDTRLQQISALVDEARSLASELCDEVSADREERFHLTSLRLRFNQALKTLNLLTGDAA
jgi:hypothetical protein